MNPAEEQRGTKWLKFYIFWRFPIGIVFGALTIIQEISTIYSGRYSGEGLIWGLLIIDICLYIFRIVVYKNMKEMKEMGYLLNNLLLAIEPIYFAFSGYSQEAGSGMIVFRFVVYLLIWSLTNYIYFRHRRHLFIPEGQEGPLRNAPRISPLAANVGKPLSIEKLVPAPSITDTDQTRTGSGFGTTVKQVPELSQIKFCRMCGNKLNADASFCPKCGTQIAIASNKTETSVTTGYTQTGNNKGQQEKPQIEIKNLPPTLRRAFLFVEDGEWEKADAYFERVLDEEPENAYAYLGKLLVERKAADLEQLSQNAEMIKESKYYRRALQFADPDLHKILISMDPDEAKKAIVSIKKDPEEAAETQSHIRQKPIDEAGMLSVFAALMAAANGEDMYEGLEEKGKRRDQLFDGQRLNADDYGYSEENPIMTSTIARTDDYLQKLRAPDGRSFTWERNGSISMREVHGVKSVIVDSYTLYLEGEKYKTIYICPYGHQSTTAPKGLALKEQ